MLNSSPSYQSCFQVKDVTRLCFQVHCHRQVRWRRQRQSCYWKSEQVFYFLFLLNVLNLKSRSLMSKKLVWASDDPSHRIKIENGLSQRQCHDISRGLYRSIGYIRSVMSHKLWLMVPDGHDFRKTRWPNTLNLKFRAFEMAWNRHFRLLKNEYHKYSFKNKF